MSPMDDTHDPDLESWVESANDPATDFPLQNLPFGRLRRPTDSDWRIGVAIGDQVLDLRRARRCRPSAVPPFRSFSRRAARGKIGEGNYAAPRRGSPGWQGPPGNCP
jgi:fumarylacetoacetase